MVLPTPCSTNMDFRSFRFPLKNYLKKKKELRKLLSLDQTRFFFLLTYRRACDQKAFSGTCYCHLSQTPLCVPVLSARSECFNLRRPAALVTKNDIRVTQWLNDMSFAYVLHSLVRNSICISENQPFEAMVFERLRFQMEKLLLKVK